MLPARRPLYRSATPLAPAPAARVEPRRKPRAKTADGARHIALVKALPCACCEAPGPSDAHHIREGQGGAQRAPDFLAIPLCKECHQGSRGLHGDRTRLALRKLDELDMLADTVRRLTCR